jgi:predicted porin
MRKVLLATTALVAMGGVSAASADITLSASSEFQYITNSGTGTTPLAAEDRDVATQVDFGLAASAALDNGMTVAAGIDLDEGVGDQPDDSGFTLSGDFGTIGFGGYAEAVHGGMSTDVTADEGWTLHANYKKPADEYIAHSDLSLKLPAVSGVTLSVGMSDGATSSADGTQAGLSYTMAAGSMTVTVGYGTSSTGAADSDATSTGVKVVAGNTTVVAAVNETGKHSGNSVGITYKVSDVLTVQAYTGTMEKSDVAAYEAKDTGIGFSYTVTPGLTLAVTQNDFSGKGDATAGAEDGSRTAITLNASY